MAYEMESILGSDGDTSRTIVIRVTMNERNAGAEPVLKRMRVIMFRSGQTWYVDPNSLGGTKVQTTDAPGTWRNLTYDEWDYLIHDRNTSSGIRYAKATVNGVQGLIIVPDNWSRSTYALNSTNTSGAAFNANVLTAAQWATLENAGCAFLPAAGRRLGTSVSNVGSSGDYWSTTTESVHNDALYLNFEGGVYTGTIHYRYYGRSVRLVRTAQ
jgi:hypothetical protein